MVLCALVTNVMYSMMGPMMAWMMAYWLVFSGLVLVVLALIAVWLFQQVRRTADSPHWVHIRCDLAGRRMAAVLGSLCQRCVGTRAQQCAADGGSHAAECASDGLAGSCSMLTRPSEA